MKKIIKFIVLLAFTSSLSFGAEDIFNISTVNNKKLTLRGTDDGIIVDQYKGKIVFLEFWGTWCGPCLLSIPHHVKMQDKYKNNLRIVSFETTPSVTKEALVKYIKDPKNIDMSKVQWFIKNKARSPEAKKYLENPVNELKKFREADKAINYDVVAYPDAKEFISYIAYRAKWQGSIPYLLVFDGEGKLISAVPGMLSEEKLENIVKSILKAQKGSKRDSNSTK